MIGSRHHVGEWELCAINILLPTGHVAHVPFLALDYQSAKDCVRFSLALLGYPLLRGER